MVAMMGEALALVLLINASYACFIVLGLVDSALTEDGPDHYAEKPLTFISRLLPGVPMPLNTVVNMGYVLVGGWCLVRVWRAARHRQLSHTDAYCAYVFCWFSIIYGPIQLARILTQDHYWAIADQWVTLPIFSWVCTWGLSVLWTWSNARMLTITTLSITSYFLTLLTTVGFEIALGLHVICAVSVGVTLLLVYPSGPAHRAFILAIACCSGFVVLKLLDHSLANVHTVFQVFSGHFLSKIADFMQIYYVTDFFYCLTREKYGVKKSAKSR